MLMFALKKINKESRRLYCNLLAGVISHHVEAPIITGKPGHFVTFVNIEILRFHPQYIFFVAYAII